MAQVARNKFSGLYTVTDRDQKSIATKSLVPGTSVYGEKLIKIGDDEFRLWSPRRSKLAAAIKRGLTEMPIQPGSKVLYLGAASGTTISHCSDIIGPNGLVYGVEFSQRTMRDLIQLAVTRPNILPILDDARHPARYAPLVSGSIEVVYQDVAQPDQASILYENLKTFCSFGAWGMLAIKARSIDSTGNLDEIYSKEIALLDNKGLEIVENIDLDPLEKDHRFIVCRVTEDMT
ncbi:MAG: fibrillarin-like rRNA/tRNA 2'-O-methyltransferase [Candidatus Thorarchaeota archaeon]|nr:fibrillarin-like rRNA/tRNA 2'-O-methyltransferase [Candidatus Thorarchaeota archaeon]